LDWRKSSAAVAEGSTAAYVPRVPRDRFVTGGAENPGVENAGVENTGAITYGKPSNRK